MKVRIWKGIPVKTLRSVPAFARAFAQAYARANAGAKVKGGGVIPESGCEVGVTVPEPHSNSEILPPVASTCESSSNPKQHAGSSLLAYLAR